VVLKGVESVVVLGDAERDDASFYRIILRNQSNKNIVALESKSWLLDASINFQAARHRRTTTHPGGRNIGSPSRARAGAITPGGYVPTSPTDQQI
jgi:hypothetical protein